MDTQRENLAYLLGDVSRLIRRTFQQRIEGSTLTLAQARALVYISRNEGMRQVDLAEMLEIQPITLARLIDLLEQNELVERRSAPADRRVCLLFLTPAATPHLAAIREVARTIFAEVLHGVDKQQIAAFHAVLHRMRENLGTR